MSALPHDFDTLLALARAHLARQVAKELRGRGFEVFNPAGNVDGDTGRPRSFYMRLDIPALLASEAVVLLPGWRESRGASLEVWIAVDLDMPLYQRDRANGELLLEAIPPPALAGLPFQR